MNTEISEAREIIEAFLSVVQTPEGESDGCPVCVLISNAKHFMDHTKPKRVRKK
jgi:hypothetical protein